MPIWPAFAVHEAPAQDSGDRAMGCWLGAGWWRRIMNVDGVNKPRPDVDPLLQPDHLRQSSTSCAIGTLHTISTSCQSQGSQRIYHLLHGAGVALDASLKRNPLPPRTLLPEAIPRTDNTTSYSHRQRRTVTAIESASCLQLLAYAIRRQPGLPLPTPLNSSFAQVVIHSPAQPRRARPFETKMTQSYSRWVHDGSEQVLKAMLAQSV